MKPHHLPPKSALRTLGLFLGECSRDRTRDSLPLRELLDSRTLFTFQDSLEEVLRAILVDYSEERDRLALAHACRRAGGHSLH
jgi:hypothetical protein